VGQPADADAALARAGEDGGDGVIASRVAIEQARSALFAGELDLADATEATVTTIDRLKRAEDSRGLGRAHLNLAAVGQSSSSAAVRLSQLANELPPSLDVIGQAAIATLLEMVSSETSSRMVVGGMPNLTRYGAEFQTTVAPVLEALEEQVVLLKLLGEVGTSDVTVRIGQENSVKELQSTSVVASGYGSQLDTFATLGVVGPTRMDYPSTMASVRAVARYVGRFLSEG